MAPGSRPQYRVLVEKGVPMQTRDGVTLRADVYRPDAPGRFPVLLSRLPYNKHFAQPLSDQAYRRLPLMAWGDLSRLPPATSRALIAISILVRIRLRGLVGRQQRRPFSTISAIHPIYYCR